MPEDRHTKKRLAQRLRKVRGVTKLEFKSDYIDQDLVFDHLNFWRLAFRCGDGRLRLFSLGVRAGARVLELRSRPPKAPPPPPLREFGKKNNGKMEIRPRFLNHSISSLYASRLVIN